MGVLILILQSVSLWASEELYSSKEKPTGTKPGIGERGRMRHGIDKEKKHKAGFINSDCRPILGKLTRNEASSAKRLD